MMELLKRLIKEDIKNSCDYGGYVDIDLAVENIIATLIDLDIVKD